MSTASPPFDFDAHRDFVAEYDRGPPLFVPGYRASHFMAGAILLDMLAPDAQLLIVGAGGGVEIAAFAGLAPDWRFTGVDPSEAMLDLGQARLERSDLNERVSWWRGTAVDAPAGPFDAATAFLALAFVPDDGSRLAQTRAIHERLRPGSPFLLINAVSTPACFERDLRRYALHARMRGAETALIEQAVCMQREHLHILSSSREKALLLEAGFASIERFYQGLWVHGWLAIA